MWPVVFSHFSGSLDGPLCSWPGITCDWTGCTVEELECDTCSGRLPQDIPLKRLERAAGLKQDFDLSVSSVGQHFSSPEWRCWVLRDPRSSSTPG